MDFLRAPGSGMSGGLSGSPFPASSPGSTSSASGYSAEEEARMSAAMKSLMESCPFKMVLSGTMGFGMGAAIGIFTASMRYDTPMSSAIIPAGTTTSAAGTTFVSDLPIRQQLSHGLKDVYRSAASNARNFGRIGALFSVLDCCIEGLRGRNDSWNGVASGFLVGGILARSGGPKAVVLGAGGFAAFSGAIEWYMRSGDTERRYPVI